MIFRKILIFRKCYFPERKIFLSVWLHFKKCCEKYFLVFGCMVENAIFLQQQKSKSHRKHIFSPAKQIYNFIPQFRNTNKTQEKKKSYSGQIERRRKRRRTIGFGVRRSRSGTTNLGSRWGTTNRCCDCDRDRREGEVERRSRRVKSNGDVERRSRRVRFEVEAKQLCALGSISFWVRSLWLELGWSEGCALSLSLLPL